MNFATLPDFWRAWPRTAPPSSVSRCWLVRAKDLDAMVAAGWQHAERSLPGIRTAVELSSESPHGGRLCLHLAAAATTDKPPGVL